jgi:hypothetical protein
MSQAPTSKPTYQQSASVSERARMLQEERVANTRAAMTAVVSPEAGGRFAHRLIEQINSAGPTVEYPRLPEGSPWSGPQVGDEPLLGYSVEDLEPTGEPHEVAAGLSPPDNAEAGTASSPANADLSTVVGNLAGSSPPTSAPQLPDVAVATARPYSKRGSMTRRFG